MTHPVRVAKQDGKFTLLRDGKPYYILGVRPLGSRYIDRAAAFGANAIRIGTEELPEILDKCEALGLTVLIGLPVRAERDGFDYGDRAAVIQQRDRCLEMVKRYREHPALLSWAIGNELDHIPNRHDYDLRLWDAVNEIAEGIHRLDPDHPAMTVVGMGNYEKLGCIMRQCPALDLLGINAYKAIELVPGWLSEYGWDRPFAVTEWGMSGNWEMPKTRFGVSIEESSTEKADRFRERYRAFIAGDPRCVGSYAFLWASNRQEHTHTWFNMFYDDGSATECVQAMGEMWTGKPACVPAPRLKSLTIGGKAAGESVSCRIGEEYEALAEVESRSGDRLAYSWEFVPENKSFGSYAGHGEIKPEAVQGCVVAGGDGPRMRFRLPENDAFDIRLYVYVHDEHGSVALGNIPLHVER